MIFNTSTVYSKENEPDGVLKSCTSSREFIATLQYLRDNSELKIPENEARKVAMTVSQGCTGAALRFIKVHHVLTTSGLGANDALKVSEIFAKKTNPEATTFVTVFLKSFLEEELDLDMNTAVELARSLSSEFQGDTLGVRKDFEKLVRFCVNTQDLNLPKPECARFSSRLAKFGEKFGGETADAFIRLYSFLVTEEGPALTRKDAMQLAERLLNGGKDSPDNFIQAFKYAVSHRGLNLGIREAIDFAENLTTPKT